MKEVLSQYTRTLTSLDNNLRNLIFNKIFFKKYLFEMLRFYMKSVGEFLHTKADFWYEDVEFALEILEYAVFAQQVNVAEILQMHSHLEHAAKRHVGV